MCRCEGYGFQAVYSRIGCINQNVQVLNRVSFFRKLISWLKILDQGNSYSRIGGFREFTLVKGSKIQLNQLWYRLRVPGSQWHIPTQKFLKQPPPPPGRSIVTENFCVCLYCVCIDGTFEHFSKAIRPISNVVLLPCRTQLIELNSTLARQQRGV